MIKIFLFTSILLLHPSNSQDDCKPAICGPSGPIIRFPFRLKYRHPMHCGYPGFDLSCTQNNMTELEFQFPVTASTNKVTVPLNMTVSVGIIDYKAQKMLVRNAVPRSCLPGKVPTLNTSEFVFEVEALGYNEGYTLFNCTNARDFGERIACLSSHRSYQVFAFASVYEITSLPAGSSCFKMYNVSFLPDNLFSRVDDDYGGTPFYLHWRKPDCRICEGKGRNCRMSTAGESECFGHGGASRHHSSLTAGVTVGTLLLICILVVSYFILRSAKTTKDERKRIESALQNSKHAKTIARFSYKDIKKITRNFNEKLGERSSLYKGMLEDKTLVAVKMLDVSFNDLINAVDRISRMQHENILKLIGYCPNGIVYEMPSRGTLERVTSTGKLDWEKQCQIIIGIAKGIIYVHEDNDLSNLGLNVTSYNVFLELDMIPKVLVCIEDEEGIGYTAPEVLWGGVSVVDRKLADVYSLGMVMVEMVEGMSGYGNGRKEEGDVYFPEWICNKMRNEEEEEEDWGFKMIGAVGLQCIRWFPCDRPSVEDVIQMLQGDSIPFDPPNLDLSGQL